MICKNYYPLCHVKLPEEIWSRLKGVLNECVYIYIFISTGRQSSAQNILQQSNWCIYIGSCKDLGSSRDHKYLHWFPSTYVFPLPTLHTKNATPVELRSSQIQVTHHRFAPPDVVKGRFVPCIFFSSWKFWLIGFLGEVGHIDDTREINTWHGILMFSRVVLISLCAWKVCTLLFIQPGVAFVLIWNPSKKTRILWIINSLL